MKILDSDFDPSDIAKIGISYGDDVPTTVSLVLKDEKEINIKAFTDDLKVIIREQYDELLAAVIKK